jgi:ribosomal-protein-alanine N-acetyltransferase
MAQSGILSAARLQLIPFGEEHLTPRYLSWLNDPEVVRYSEQRHNLHTLETCRAYWQSFASTPSYFWAIVAEDAAVGHIGNLNAYIDAQHQVADLGILLGEKQAWGHGYATEAWQAACDFCLRDLGLRKVTAGTLSVNLPMLRLMKGTGMKPDGIRVRHKLWEGQEVDVIHYALFRVDWQTRSLAGEAQA